MADQASDVKVNLATFWVKNRIYSYAAGFSTSPSRQRQKYFPRSIVKSVHDGDTLFLHMVA